MDRAADSGLYDPSLIPLGEKKENKQKRDLGWPILKEKMKLFLDNTSSAVTTATPVVEHWTLNLEGMGSTRS